jgi:hydrogenase maturation protease
LGDEIRNHERDMESFLSSDTVVIGVGNTIRSDDGVGVHAARLLQVDPRLPAGITVLDGGTMGLELVSFTSNASHVLLLDAMNSGSVPGTLARMTGRDLLATKQGWSVHELALTDLISALFLVATRPQEIVVMGVQPSNTDWGTTLSAEVNAVLELLIDAAVSQLQLWSDSRKVQSSAKPSSLTPASSRRRTLSKPCDEGGF